MENNSMFSEEEVKRLGESFKARVDAIKSLFRMMHDFEIVEISDVPGYGYRVRNTVDGRELCVCKTRIDAELVVQDHTLSISHIALTTAMSEQERKIREMKKAKEDAQMRDYFIPRPEPAKPAETPKEGEGNTPEFVPTPEGYVWPMPPVVENK